MRAGFPHSDILGSKLRCQLPETFRRLARPSSPVIAKASTTCTYSLDPITLDTINRHGSLRNRWPAALQGLNSRSTLHLAIRSTTATPDRQADAITTRVLASSANTLTSSRIVKEQPISNGALHAPPSYILCRMQLVEPSGIEPLTSWLQTRRSPS